MRLRHLFKNRGLGVNLLASSCFLLLAVYGWGMTWEKLGSFLFVLIVLLGGVVAAAALCGWLLRKILRMREKDFVMPSDETETSSSQAQSANQPAQHTSTDSPSPKVD